MVTINDVNCSGCGQCVDVCPTGALVLQNNHVFIHQDICDECEICLDACPHGAIQAGEPLSVVGDVVRMPAVPQAVPVVQIQTAQPVSLQEMVIPTFGSVLVWTGRQLVPRLADLALGYLESRFQTANTVPNNPSRMVRGRGFSTSTRGRRSGRRRQRRARRKMKS
jgi:NAD-dependent dihydropyrimidine dehydrogenase PreA subunit